jgi:hypothetical protein
MRERDRETLDMIKTRYIIQKYIDGWMDAFFKKKIMTVCYCEKQFNSANPNCEVTATHNVKNKLT